MGGNFFGNGSDGNVVISADTEINSTQDGDYIIKQYSTLTIDVTKKLTVDDRCKGLFIYVKGNCVINGELSMTDRGASGNPVGSVSVTGIRLPMLKSGDGETLAGADFAGCGAAVITAVANQPAISGDGIIFEIVRTGGLGPTGRVTTGNGADGGEIANGTGSGGAGGKITNNDGRSGDGGNGTCWSGGSAGGGASGDIHGGDAGDTGGPGGDGKATAARHAGGGAGNPGGAGAGVGSAGENGTGGIIWLIVGGDLTIGASGVIEAKGADGGLPNAAGGGSGGGVIKIAYAGALSNNGSISVLGGFGGDSIVDGGDGGDGTYELVQVDEAVIVSGNIMMMAKVF